jgi:putative membrane protein insertion efficiency factor
MKKLLILLINAYQFIISPFFGNNCRFYPSCSHYSQLCLQKFSIPLALWYTTRRICKCHPFHPGGHDPVP